MIFYNKFTKMSIEKKLFTYIFLLYVKMPGLSKKPRHRDGKTNTKNKTATLQPT